MLGALFRFALFWYCLLFLFHNPETGPFLSLEQWQVQRSNQGQVDKIHIWQTKIYSISDIRYSHSIIKVASIDTIYWTAEEGSL